MGPSSKVLLFYIIFVLKTIAMSTNNDYILGTDREELYRLGIQHQIWASEAHYGWKEAGFTQGNTILDLGCGPGFCAKELGFIVGPKGKVIAVDKSKPYIDYLDKTAALHGLNIQTINTDFADLRLESNSLDGAYCRWAMAWQTQVPPILKKVLDALKPGGVFVLHEYYDWTTHQTSPSLPNIKKAIAACHKSFEDAGGDISIGRKLPMILSELGAEVRYIRPMTKISTPDKLSWQWPRSFYEVYFPKIVDMGHITNSEMYAAFAELEKIEQTPGASLFCPMMVEVAVEKKI